MDKMSAAVQRVRIIHAVFVFATLLYIYMPFLLHLEEHAISSIIPLAFGFVSAGNIALALYFRARKITPAEEILGTKPDDEAALGLWQSGVVISLVLCEAVVLFGFVLKVLGASWNVSGIFYAVGLLLMLAWTPRLDVSSA